MVDVIFFYRPTIKTLYWQMNEINIGGLEQWVQWHFPLTFTAGPWGDVNARARQHRFLFFCRKPRCAWWCIRYFFTLCFVRWLVFFANAIHCFNILLQALLFESLWQSVNSMPWCWRFPVKCWCTSLSSFFWIHTLWCVRGSGVDTLENQSGEGCCSWCVSFMTAICAVSLCRFLKY